LAVADPTGHIRAEAEGCCSGRIRTTDAGHRGFGYDCLFEIVEYHRTLAELGERWIDAQYFKEAERVLDEGVSMLRTALPDDSWRIAVIDARLGECLLKQNSRLEEAENLLVRSYERLYSSLNPDDQQLQRTVRQIVALYEVISRPKEVERYRALISDPESAGAINLPPW
jgi:hypothetical protein